MSFWCEDKTLQQGALQLHALWRGTSLPCLPVGKEKCRQVWKGGLGYTFHFLLAKKGRVVLVVGMSLTWASPCSPG